MAKPEYCKDCKRKVTPKGWNPGVLLGIAILAPMFVPIAGLVITVICVVFLVKGQRCPMCNGKNFKKEEKVKK